MGGYIGSSVGNLANAAERKQTYSITTSTTSLTGLAYTPTKVHVFHNGVRLVDGTDYTATNGTSITLTNAAQNGDEVVVISYPSFQTSDTVSAANGGTFAGNVTFSGTTTGLDVNGTDLILDADGDSKIEASTDDTITVHTAGSERMKIDSSGNVFINNGVLYLDDNGSHNGIINSPASFRVNIDSDNGATGESFTVGTNQTAINDSNVLFRVKDNGEVYIGTTSLPSNGSGGAAFRADSNSRRNLYLSTASANNQGLVVFDNPNGSVGSITTNGSATAYNTSSDYRLKENVTNISNGITRVKQLLPKRFNFIADANKTVDGFLAHEAQTVVPEAVTGTHNEVDNDGNAVMQGIDQSKLVPLLTAALKEAITKIEDLETRVAALEGA